ncbi:MAG: RsmB/NOP family class I SAM-dependent RNA methyltransferase [bacterium]
MTSTAPNKSLPSKERQLAVEILFAAFGGKKLDRAFEDTAAIFENDTKTRLNQVYNIVYGVARRHHALTAYIDSKIRDKMPVKAGLILEIALYELAFNSSSKAYAVISDALKLADLLQFTKYKPVINAVLGRFADDIEKGVQLIVAQKQLPDYIYEEVKKTFGNNAKKVTRSFLNPSPFFLSINTLLIDAETLVSRFMEQGIEIEKVEFNGFIGFKTSDNKIFKTPEFEKGFFMIQDLSSQIAVQLLEPFEGMKMLDICTAPGGKAISAAIRANDKADITAIDLSASRLLRVHENIKRMNIKSIKVITADFMEQEFQTESFDRIFLDPPCSALGVMGRNPDVTWKKSPEAIKDLSSLQVRMLEKALSLLKKDGKLIYSVCTFTQSETTAVIAQAASKTLYTLPNEVGMDGLFIAVLEKK